MTTTNAYDLEKLKKLADWADREIALQKTAEIELREKIASTVQEELSTELARPYIERLEKIANIALTRQINKLVNSGPKGIARAGEICKKLGVDLKSFGSNPLHPNTYGTFITAGRNKPLATAEHAHIDPVYKHVKSLSRGNSQGLGNVLTKTESHDLQKIYEYARKNKILNLPNKRLTTLTDHNPSCADIANGGVSHTIIGRTAPDAKPLFVQGAAMPPSRANALAPHEFRHVDQYFNPPEAGRVDMQTDTPKLLQHARLGVGNINKIPIGPHAIGKPGSNLLNRLLIEFDANASAGTNVEKYVAIRGLQQPVTKQNIGEELWQSMAYYFNELMPQIRSTISNMSVDERLRYIQRFEHLKKEYPTVPQNEIDNVIRLLRVATD